MSSNIKHQRGHQQRGHCLFLSRFETAVTPPRTARRRMQDSYKSSCVGCFVKDPKFEMLMTSSSRVADRGRN
eukprot:scaffold31340_cov53-Attheya_sp.AAC.1